MLKHLCESRQTFSLVLLHTSMLHVHTQRKTQSELERLEFLSLSPSFPLRIISTPFLILQPLALPAPPLPLVMSSCLSPTYLFCYISKML